MQYGFIFALIFCCFFSTDAAASLVPAICKDLSKIDQQNINNDFCVSILESDRQSNSSTAKQLGQISFQLTMSKAEEVRSTISTVQKKTRPDEQQVQYKLLICKVLYSRILNEMKEGVAALNGDNYSKANATVSAAVERASICGDFIEKTGGDLSLVKEKTGDFIKFSAISLGFTKLLPTIN
ncbi:hypothetical protein vseg_008880 [Gypsophila vaccaria]